MIVVVHPSVLAHSIAELVPWAKSNRLAYASAGVGGLSHLSMEIFKRAVGIEATRVPYKGAGPATSDLLGGQVQAMANAIPDLPPHARAGRLRALGTMGTERHRLLPEIPTFAEQGHQGLVINSWTGIATAAGTPRVIV
jgi:tripartite-type tricarboxylate transporter receptor subunit TctC